MLVPKSPFTMQDILKLNNWKVDYRNPWETRKVAKVLRENGYVQGSVRPAGGGAPRRMWKKLGGVLIEENTIPESELANVVSTE